MRNRFIQGLVKKAEADSRIVLVVGDLGYGVVEPFSERFPDRFFNAGVAEQNMVGLAAGLASEGFHVFVYSIANFPIFRCAEQIRNDVCYHDLPVTIVSVGGGLAYGNLGYSHHAVQDYAFMRVMPNMTILAPGDPNETQLCLDFIVERSSPCYLRLGKTGEVDYNESIVLRGEGDLEAISVQSNSNVAIVSTGAVLQSVQMLIKGIDVTGVDFYTCPIWGMHLKNKIGDKLKKYSRIITIEDHLSDGGFGSWLLEILQPAEREKIRILGLTYDVCGMVGSQKYLNEAGGINADNIEKLIST
ncbi:MAG: transketolase [Chitinophagales bacterium]|jgi:transketolase